MVYHLNMSDGEKKELHNPADMPDVMKIDTIEEPWIRATIMTPDEYLGGVLKLCQDPRHADRPSITSASVPWSSMTCRSTRWCSIFYDRLKSISKGYASFGYTISRITARVPREDVDLVNAEPVDALSMLSTAPAPRAVVAPCARS